MKTTGAIPRKRFGKTDVQLSVLGLGGHHLGSARDEMTGKHKANLDQAARDQSKKSSGANGRKPPAATIQRPHQSPNGR
jgi:hypothetical protein